MDSELFIAIKDFIIDLIMGSTPVILGIFTYFTRKKTKSDKEYRLLREENERLEKEKRESEQKARDDKQEREQKARDEKQEREQKARDKEVDELKLKVDELAEDILGVSKNMNLLSEEVSSKVSSKIRDLLNLHAAHLKYSQSLSCLIMTIGQGIQYIALDENTNKNIAAAINQHREKEQELFGNIIKSSC